MIVMITGLTLKRLNTISSRSRPRRTGVALR